MLSFEEILRILIELSIFGQNLFTKMCKTMPPPDFKLSFFMFKKSLGYNNTLCDFMISIIPLEKLQDWSDRRSQTLPNVFKRHKESPSSSTSPPKKPSRTSLATPESLVRPAAGSVRTTRSLTSLVFSDDHGFKSSDAKMSRSWTSVPNHLEEVKKFNSADLMVSFSTRVTRQ